MWLHSQRDNGGLSEEVSIEKRIPNTNATIE
jgi:hypothetical protein